MKVSCPYMAASMLMRSIRYRPSLPFRWKPMPGCGLVAQSLQDSPESPANGHSGSHGPHSGRGQKDSPEVWPAYYDPVPGMGEALLLLMCGRLIPGQGHSANAGRMRSMTAVISCRGRHPFPMMARSWQARLPSRHLLLGSGHTPWLQPNINTAGSAYELQRIQKKGSQGIVIQSLAVYSRASICAGGSLPSILCCLPFVICPRAIHCHL